MSGMVHVPQGQQMPPEVKSGALAAAGDNHSAVGKGSSSETARFCCPTVSILLGFWGFLDSLRMTEGIYMVKCACEPNRLVESFPVHTKINVQPQPLLESGS